MTEFVASNAYRKLNELTVGAIKVNAAVCYWTMSKDEFRPAFLTALQHHNRVAERSIGPFYFAFRIGSRNAQ